MNKRMPDRSKRRMTIKEINKLDELNKNMKSKDNVTLREFRYEIMRLEARILHLEMVANSPWYNKDLSRHHNISLGDSKCGSGGTRMDSNNKEEYPSHLLRITPQE